MARLAIDLNTGAVSAAFGSLPLVVKPKSRLSLEVEFRRGAVPVAHEVTGLEFAAKRPSEYDSNTVVSGDAFSASAGNRYLCLVNCDTVELRALLGMDGEEGNEEAPVDLEGDFRWLEDGLPFQSDTFPVQGKLPVAGTNTAAISANPEYPPVDRIPVIAPNAAAMRALPTLNVSLPPAVGLKLAIANSNAYRLQWFAYFPVDELPEEQDELVYLPDDSDDPDNLIALFALG